MLIAFFSALIPMLAGAQLILSLVLVKGEICPGQRGRIHRLLPALAILWAGVALLHLWSLLLTALLLGLYSQVKTGKTRDSGPLLLLWLADIAAVVMVMLTMWQSSGWISSVVVLLAVVLLGAMGAHILLTVAKSRLQAFHRILPVAGIISAMLVTLCVIPFVYQYSDQQLAEMMPTVLGSVVLLICALMIWCWHLFLSVSVNRVQLLLSGGLLVASLTGFNYLYALAI